MALRLELDFRQGATAPAPHGMTNAEALAPSIPGGGAVTFRAAVVAFKRRLLEQALMTAQGNRTAAARALGVQRTYLARSIRDLGVAAPPPRRRSRGEPPSARETDRPGQRLSSPPADRSSP
jgi:DNA-binding NtrC family response regulator